MGTSDTGMYYAMVGALCAVSWHGGGRAVSLHRQPAALSLTTPASDISSNVLLLRPSLHSPTSAYKRQLPARVLSSMSSKSLDCTADSIMAPEVCASPYLQNP